MVLLAQDVSANGFCSAAILIRVLGFAVVSRTREGEGEAPLGRCCRDWEGASSSLAGAPVKGVNWSKDPSGKGPQGHDFGFGVPEAPPEGPSGICAWSCWHRVCQQMALAQRREGIEVY